MRANLLYTGLVNAAMQNKRHDYFETARRIWLNIITRRMHISGGVGPVKKYESYADDYFLPNDAYLETCSAVTAGFFHFEMYRASGSGACMDELERVLYNAAPAGVSLKGTSYFYQNPLETDGHERWEWHWCPCCPPMLVKMLAGAARYIYSGRDEGIAVNLYAASEGKFSLTSGSVTIIQQTEYPWNGTVTLKIKPEKPAAFPLFLRLPVWCAEYTIALNGLEIKKPGIMDGYIVVNREWRAGDTIELDLAMPVVRMTTHPLVEADRGKVALQRGPVLYCVEGIDAGGISEITLPAEPELTSEYCPDLMNGIAVLRGKAHETDFTAIPFFANANRGITPMRVWLKQEGKTDDPMDAAEWGEELYREYTE